MDLSTRAAVVVTVVVVCWLSGTHAVTLCEAQGPACASCTELGNCAAAGETVTPTELCRDGQVCGTVAGVAQCMDAAGTPCECTPLTFGCDEYDPAGVTACTIEEGLSTEFAPNIVHMCVFPEQCSEGKCVDPSITTTTTKPQTCTAANANMRYPHEECKKYYTCREIQRGVYSYVPSTCPSTLVFNPDNNLCDLPDNVPGCP